LEQHWTLYIYRIGVGRSVISFVKQRLFKYY
jgi:hypothetical protein